MKNLRIQHKLFIKIKDLNYRKKYRFFIISTCFHWRFCFYLLMTNISLKLYSVRLHVQMNLKPLLKITTCGRAHNRGITWTLRCFLDMRAMYLYIYINALNVRINRGVSSEQDFYMYVLFFMGGGGHGGIKVWKWIIWRRQGVCMSPTTTPEHMHDPRVFLNLIKTDRSNSYFTY